MTIQQAPSVYDLLLALVLAGWVGFGGLKVLTAVASVLRAFAHRVSNRSRVWELEMERDELITANALLKSRGARPRKRTNPR